MLKINLPQKIAYLNSVLRQGKEILPWMKRIMELDTCPLSPYHSTSFQPSMAC
jgi:hypothetical protein